MTSATDRQTRRQKAGAAPENGAAKSSSGAEPLILDSSNPLAMVDAFIAARYILGKVQTLHYTNGTTYVWNQSHYAVMPDDRLRSELYAFFELGHKRVQDRESKHWALLPFKPTKGIINSTIDALRGRIYIEATPPCWLSRNEDLPDPRELVVAKNGIVDMTADTPTLFHSPMPELFTLNALNYDFIPDAPAPVAWLHFLNQLWSDDPQAIQLLQEWFGYVVSQDTSQQKILMLLGPPRSGKGTIARVLTQMISVANVCGPTLASFAQNFGLWALLGKQLAIVSDARLSGKTDQAVVVERMLSISGEDCLSIDRKNQPPIHVTLPTRLMIISNELPRLSDSSGALVDRLLILPLTHSFLGKEDTGLTEKVCHELPGILLWALEGWRRLQKRGHFLPPATSADIAMEMMDLASPTSAFVRECCVRDPAAEVATSDLYDAWVVWCKRQGRDQVPNIQVFGRDLRAAMPQIGIRKTREGDERVRVYRGLKLNQQATNDLQQFMAAKYGVGEP
jgi:putative DNA primase/helicase